MINHTSNEKIEALVVCLDDRRSMYFVDSSAEDPIAVRHS